MEKAASGERRRSSFPKEFTLVGEDEDGQPVFEDAGEDEDLDLLYPGTPALSDEEDDHHVLGLQTSDRNKHGSYDDAADLCAFCARLPLEQLGFVRGGQFLFREYKHERRTIADVSASSDDGCLLCRDVQGILDDFCRQNDAWASNPDGQVFYSIEKIGEWSPEAGSSEYGDRHLFRLGLAFDDEHGRRRPRLTFQRSQFPPLTVQDFCEDEPFDAFRSVRGAEPCEGRLRPLEIDFRLLGRWDAACSKLHGRQCRGLFEGPLPQNLRFIDVEQERLVDGRGEDPYLGLSYVWGTSQLPCLTTATEERYRQPGSLNRSLLPRTIADAIQVTRKLGYRYIWIDCLCILQDSDADKAVFIPQMDSVYGHAAITIVAASGLDVSAGLPGLAPGSRASSPNALNVGGDGSGLLRCLEPLGPGISVVPAGGYAEETAWATRAWTFQEKLFAARCLIFTSGQAYWACQRASWCEDGAWELHDGPTAFRWALQTDRNRLPWSADPERFRRLYQDLVASFNRRRLSFELDSLDAFAGIVRALERATVARVSYGLPCNSLERALDWRAMGGSSLRRRYDARTDEVSAFPTWSWVAWIGLIEPYGYTHIAEGASSEERWATLGLAFYAFGEGGGVERLEQPRGFEAGVVAEYLRKDNDQGLKSVVEAKDLPPAAFASGVPETLLCFWTDTVRVDVDPDGGSGKAASSAGSGREALYDFRLSYEFDEEDGLKLKLRGCMPLPEHASWGELVVIGRRLLLPEEIVTLFVSYEDGLAYRRGSLTVLKSDWARLEGRAWKLVALG